MDHHMTKELLEQYPHICADIEDLARRIKSPVTDTVSGSAEDFPYNQHPISICGLPLGLAEQKQAQEEKKCEIESWVNSLPQARMKVLVRLHVYDGLDWPEVSVKMDRLYKHQKKGNSPDALRVAYGRLFEK